MFNDISIHQDDSLPPHSQSLSTTLSTKSRSKKSYLRREQARLATCLPDIVPAYNGSPLIDISNHTRFIVSCFVIIITMMTYGSKLANCQESSQPEILVAPAEFVYYFDSPSSSESILRPTSIYFDRFFGETFVADQGHNRVMIFDREGHFKHEFTGSGYFSSPVDLAVDAEGYIWILGSTLAGRQLFKFDFDGLFLQSYMIPKMYANSSVSVTSFDLSEDGRLFLFDQVGTRMLVMDSLGQIESAFELLTGIDKRMRKEQVVGNVQIYRDNLIIVSGTIGSAYVYDLTGKLKRKVGNKGGELGQMTFPVAARMTINGTIVMLDKMSHNMVVFDSLSRPVAEIGGKGQSPGWFYQPTLLELDDQGRVMIGQIFNSRVQACNLPELSVFDSQPKRNHSAVNDQFDSNRQQPLTISSTEISMNMKSATEATTLLSVFGTKRIPRRYF